MSRTFAADSLPAAWYDRGQHIRVLHHHGAVLIAGRLNTSWGERGVMHLTLETDEAALPIEFEVPEGARVEAAG